MLDWHHKAAESVCNWWEVAGVETAAQDVSHDWLGRQAATVRAVPPSLDVERAAERRELHPALQPVARDTADLSLAAADPLAAMPADADGFVTWLRDGAALPGTAGLGPRILPMLRPDAPWMVVTDMPQRDDETEGALLAGALGDLLGAILRAVGTQREAASLTSVVSTRLPSRRFDDDGEEAALVTMLQRQVDIATPATVLMFGDLAQRVGDALPGRADEDGLPVVNHPGGKSRLVMLPHLDMMMRRPMLKAEAWNRLRPLLKDTAR